MVLPVRVIEPPTLVPTSDQGQNVRGSLRRPVNRPVEGSYGDWLTGHLVYSGVPAGESLPACLRGHASSKIEDNPLYWADTPNRGRYLPDFIARGSKDNHDWNNGPVYVEKFQVNRSILDAHFQYVDGTLGARVDGSDYLLEEDGFNYVNSRSPGFLYWDAQYEEYVVLGLADAESNVANCDILGFTGSRDAVIGAAYNPLVQIMLRSSIVGV